MLAAGGVAYLQGGKVGGDNADQKLKITGISATALTEFEIVTAGHGIAKVNGARIYTEQYVPTPSVLGVVPDTRTVNGKRLNADITVTSEDVGAYDRQG
ncbi:proximal tail fiber subunit [Aeromonas phage AhSzq-1]|uniref:Proximal tail fiber subunit n=1 Tax=Aeromonas phage AhSzq-1 TaxID=2138298 RepID=A0A2R4ALV4_9CAUD|nr:proximal tail fiber subunit [Aeromonas phage AhSzq-1]AVR76008.1 proximal tail fiber subunit [Aeromonas phage AhSzq-1]